MEERSSDTFRPVPDLVPARMLNEFAYCPRLCFLEWVDGEFEDSADTLDGKHQHRRVDRGGPPLPEPEAGAAGEVQEGKPDHAAAVAARSVYLSAPKLGLIMKADLVEAEGSVATPVDTKRGKKPDLPEGAYEPDRVQLCVQGLVLRENGFICDHGYIYFAGSRERVEVNFDDALVRRTIELLAEMRKTVSSGVTPPPLKDSPKCEGCSLAGICLPDEINLLRDAPAPDRPSEKVRPIFPPADDALPLYVQSQKKHVGKDGEVLVVKESGQKVAEAPFMEVSQICLFGNVGITAHALREAVQRGIPVCHLSYGGWFEAITHGMFHKNIELRRIQFLEGSRKGKNRMNPAPHKIFELRISAASELRPH